MVDSPSNGANGGSGSSSSGANSGGGNNSNGRNASSVNISQKRIAWTRIDTAPNPPEVYKIIHDFLTSLEDFPSGTKLSQIPYTYSQKNGNQEPFKVDKDTRELIFRNNDREFNQNDILYLYPSDLSTFLRSIYLFIIQYKPEPLPSFDFNPQILNGQTEAEFFDENKTIFSNQIRELKSKVDLKTTQSTVSFAEIGTIRFPTNTEYFSHISEVVLPLLAEFNKIKENTKLKNPEYPIQFAGANYRLLEIKEYLNKLILLINHDFTDPNPRNSELAKIRTKLSSPVFVKNQLYLKTIKLLIATNADKEKTSFVSSIDATNVTLNRFKDLHTFFNVDPYAFPSVEDKEIAESLVTIFNALIKLSEFDDSKIKEVAEDKETSEPDDSGTQEEPKVQVAQPLTLSELLEFAKANSFKAVYQAFLSSPELSALLQAWADQPENDTLDLSSIWKWIDFQLTNKQQLLAQKSSDIFNSSKAVDDAINLRVPFYNAAIGRFNISPSPDSEYSLWTQQIIAEIQAQIFIIFLDFISGTLPEFRALQTLPDEQITPSQQPGADLATAGIPANIVQVLSGITGAKNLDSALVTIELLKELQSKDQAKYFAFLKASKIEDQLYLQMQFALLDQLNKQGFAFSSIDDIPRDFQLLLRKDIQNYLQNLSPEMLLRALSDKTTRLQIYSEFSRRFILQQLPSSIYLAGHVAVKHKEKQQNTDIYLTTVLETYLASPTKARKESVIQRLQALLVVTGYTPDKNQDLASLSQTQLEALLGFTFSNKKLSPQELAQFVKALQEYTDAYYFRQQFEKTTILSRVAKDATNVKYQTELSKEKKASTQFISDKNKALVEIGAFISNRVPSEIIDEAKKLGIDPDKIARLEALQKDSTGKSKNFDPSSNSISEYATFVEYYIADFLNAYPGTTYFNKDVLAAFFGISTETLSSDAYKKFATNSLPIFQDLITTYVRVYELPDATIRAAFRQLAAEKLINDSKTLDPKTNRNRVSSFGGLVPLTLPKDQQNPNDLQNHAKKVGVLLDEFGKEIPKDSFRKRGVRLNDDIASRIEHYLLNEKNWIYDHDLENQALNPWQLGLNRNSAGVLPVGFTPYEDDFGGETESQSRFTDSRDNRFGVNQNADPNESTIERLARQMNLAGQDSPENLKKDGTKKVKSDAKSALEKLKKSSKKKASKKAKQLRNRGILGAARVVAQLILNAMVMAAKFAAAAIVGLAIKFAWLFPVLIKGALIVGAAAAATALAVGAVIAIFEGAKWLAQQAWSLAQTVWNAGVNIFSSIANGISSIFSGGAVIPATAGTAAFVTFAAVTLSNEMVNDAMYLIPQLTDDSLSRYVDIEKTASPSRFDNGAVSEIEYTIVISAKDPDNYSVEISNISDRLTVDFKEESTPEFTPVVRTVTNYQPPTFGAPVETAEDTNTVSTESITLDTNNPEITLTYTQPIASTIIDATVINTISLDLIATPISSDGETDSSPISESVSRVEMVCIGDCPQTSEMAWPTSGVITQLPFKYNFLTVDGKIDLNLVKYGTHDTTRNGQRIGADAIDIAAPAGTPIYAPFDAEVLQQLKPYGNTTGVLSFAEAFGPYHIVLSRVPDKVQYVFAHNSSMSVRAGQTVKKCQIIGTVGNYGPLSTGNHLHFERGFEKDGRIFMNLKENDTSILIEEFSTSNLTDTDGNKIDGTSYQKRVKSECDQN